MNAAPPVARLEAAKRAYKAGTAGARAVIATTVGEVEATVVDLGEGVFAFTRGAPVVAPVVVRWL